MISTQPVLVRNPSDFLRIVFVQVPTNAGLKRREAIPGPSSFRVDRDIPNDRRSRLRDKGDREELDAALGGRRRDRERNAVPACAVLECLSYQHLLDLLENPPPPNAKLLAAAQALSVAR